MTPRLAAHLIDVIGLLLVAALTYGCYRLDRPRRERPPRKDSVDRHVERGLRMALPTRQERGR